MKRGTQEGVAELYNSSVQIKVGAMSSAELIILWGLGAVCLLFTLRMHLFLVAVNKQYLMARRQSAEAFHSFSVSMLIVTYSWHKPVSPSQLNVWSPEKGISVFSSALLTYD